MSKQKNSSSLSFQQMYPTRAPDLFEDIQHLQKYSMGIWIQLAMHLGKRYATTPHLTWGNMGKVFFSLNQRMK